MAKHRSTASLVVLALLMCFVGMAVEAQDPIWQKPGTQTTKGSTSPQVPQVLPRPQPPKAPQYPHVPKIQPAPQYPHVPKVQPAPQYPHVPVVQPAPQYPHVPKVQPAPQYPHVPKVQPAPQYPHVPKVQPAPQYPHVPKVQPAPKYPLHGMRYDQSSQVPQIQEPQDQIVPQIPSVSKLSAEKHPAPVQTCEVEASVRVPCGSPDISAAGCEAINCCFDGQQCYFGWAVTVQCTKDAQFIVVVAKDATLPPIDLQSISLLGQGQGCTHVDSNSKFAIYQFPVTSCGSVVMEEPGVIIYENRMVSSFEVLFGPHGDVSRDSDFELLFQCRYIGTSVETVIVEVLPLENPPLPAAGVGPIRVSMRLANGQCTAKGCNEVDAAFTSFYTEADYPVTKVLRDPVYVEVQLLEKMDPLLVLTLDHCWATTTSNPHSLPQWDILIGGCPYRDDRYLSSVIPVDSSSGLDFPSHYSRFLFKMFTFVNPTSYQPLREQIFIHCSTAVCAAAPGRNCEPSCYRTKRDVKAVEQRTQEPKVVVSSGPLVINTPEQ